MIPHFSITYGYSDGQGPFTDTLPAQDIQVALYQFARKHPNVAPENINKIKQHKAVLDVRSNQKARDPLGQIPKRKTFLAWRMLDRLLPTSRPPEIDEVIQWVEETRP
jgi:hypothetical protein